MYLSAFVLKVKAISKQACSKLFYSDIKVNFEMQYIKNSMYLYTHLVIWSGTIHKQQHLSCHIFYQSYAKSLLV